MGRIGLFWLAAVALVAAAMPSAAHAVSVRVSGQVVGPHVDRARVVWGEQERGRLRVRAADAAGAQREIGVVPSLPGRSAFDLALGGGGVAVSRVGWPASAAPVEPDRYDVALVGAAPWIDCTAPGGFLSTEPPRIAGDGVTVASPGAGCRGDAVLVRTPGAPDRIVVEPGPVVDLRVTGDWLAATVNVGGTGLLVVHDLRTQREAYRVVLSPPSFSFGSTPPYAFDVDRDGTTVVGEPNLITITNADVAPGPGCMSWWASPAEPRRHAIPFATCRSVRLRDGMLLLTRRDGPVTALVATSLTQAGAVTLRRAPSIDGIDVFAGRVAWSEQTCLETTIIRAATPQAETRPRPSGCVIRVLGRGPLRMDARGRVRLAVRCPAGCSGAVNALRCDHRRCISEPVPIRLAAGRRTTVRLTLTPRARRLVRRVAVTATLKTHAALGPTLVVQRRIITRR